MKAAALVPTATVELDLDRFRYAGVGILVVALLRPLLGNPGISCPFRWLTGFPCPFCGMTRGVTDIVHGDVEQAFSTNPGSVPLVAGIVFVATSRQRRRVDQAEHAFAGEHEAGAAEADEMGERGDHGCTQGRFTAARRNAAPPHRR